MAKLIFLVLLLWSQLSFSALPPEAQAYLNKIPDQKLTLPFVIKVALENADSYRLIGLDKATADLEEMTIDAQTDTYLSAGYEYGDDNSAKTNPFQPLRAKKTEWNLSMSKKWATGTTTTVGWTHDINSLEFSPVVNSFGGGGGGFITDYKQSTGFIQLEQNLLKDSFGYSLRKSLEAARMRSEALDWRVRNDLEDTTLQFINQYYMAWLLQQQVKSVQDQVARQARLVRVLGRRAKKGAVEKPDLIQVEALLASSRARLALVKAQLGNVWQSLVIGLKLPESFLSVDPMEVPTEIDSPVSQALSQCANNKPQKSAAVQSLEFSLKGLEADLKSSRNGALPDLKLQAGYRGNSIDGSGTTTFQEVLQGRDPDGIGLGPTWNVGLVLNWPLNNSMARADQIRKYIDKEKTTARLQNARDTLTVQWKDLCRRLATEKNNLAIYSNVVKEQRKRVTAENKRFRLGRVRVDQLVTAENDLGQWEFQTQQKAIDVRGLAWQVQKISGDLFESLKPYLAQLQTSEAL